LQSILWLYKQMLYGFDMSIKAQALALLLTTTASSAVTAGQQSYVDEFIAANSGNTPPTSETNCTNNNDSVMAAFRCIDDKITDLETVRDGHRTYQIKHGHQIIVRDDYYTHDRHINQEHNVREKTEMMTTLCNGLYVNLETMGNNIEDELGHFFNKFSKSPNHALDMHFNRKLSDIKSFVTNICHEP